MSDDRPLDAIRTMACKPPGPLVQVFKGYSNNGSNGLDELTIAVCLFGGQ
jgi:hypothetical protein